MSNPNNTLKNPLPHAEKKKQLIDLYTDTALFGGLCLLQQSGLNNTR